MIILRLITTNNASTHSVKRISCNDIHRDIQNFVAPRCLRLEAIHECELHVI